MGQQDDIRLCSDAEAAEMLGLSRRTIFTMRRTGRLPYLRIGKTIRIWRRDLLKFLEECQVTGGQS